MVARQFCGRDAKSMFARFRSIADTILNGVPKYLAVKRKDTGCGKNNPLQTLSRRGSIRAYLPTAREPVRPCWGCGVGDGIKRIFYGAKRVKNGKPECFKLGQVAGSQGGQQGIISCRKGDVLDVRAFAWAIGGAKPQGIRYRNHCLADGGITIRIGDFYGDVMLPQMIASVGGRWAIVEGHNGLSGGSAVFFDGNGALAWVNVAVRAESNSKKTRLGQEILGGMVSCTKRIPLHITPLKPTTLNPCVIPIVERLRIATVQGPSW